MTAWSFAVRELDVITGLPGVGITVEVRDGGVGGPGLPGDDGPAGPSAYELAVAEGFVGTLPEWLASLEGQAGADGTDGTNGTDGSDGDPGPSAYEVAVAAGFVGDEAAWLASLVGDAGDDGVDGTNGTDGTDGLDGSDGASAYEVAVANGFVGTEAAWLASLAGTDGQDGTDGTDGTNGTNGLDGDDGASAYEVAVANGFVGSEVEWLASLQGQDGVDGTNGTDGTNGLDGNDGAPGPGVPTGGTDGQVLTKTSGTDYATAWETPTGGGGPTEAPAPGAFSAAVVALSPAAYHRLNDGGSEFSGGTPAQVIAGPASLSKLVPSDTEGRCTVAGLPSSRLAVTPPGAATSDCTIMLVFRSVAALPYVRDSTSTGGWFINATQATVSGSALPGHPTLADGATRLAFLVGDGATSRLHLDPSTSRVGSRTPSAPVYPLYVARSGLNANHFAPGDYSDIAVWNRALTTAEVASLYAAFAG